MQIDKHVSPHSVLEQRLPLWLCTISVCGDLSNDWWRKWKRKVESRATEKPEHVRDLGVHLHTGEMLTAGRPEPWCSGCLVASSCEKICGHPSTRSPSLWSGRKLWFKSELPKARGLAFTAYGIFFLLFLDLNNRLMCFDPEKRPQIKTSKESQTENSLSWV